MSRRWLAVLLALQAVGAAFLVSEIGASVFGLPLPVIDWTVYEALELTAAVALIAGSAALARMIVMAQARARRAETALRAARGAFAAVMEERFDAWALTPAERDVALFALKGLSGAEIAAARGTSEGTVKAQTAAVYRKSGASGRAQLMSLFLDDLMAGEGAPGQPSEAPPSA